MKKLYTSFHRAILLLSGERNADKPIRKTTGQNINRMRIGAGMTVRDMQEVFGFTTPQAIYKWIHGTAMPTIDNMVILAAMFDVTVDEIIAVDTIDVKCG